MWSWLLSLLPHVARKRLAGSSASDGESTSEISEPSSDDWKPSLADEITMRDAATHYADRFGDHEGISDAAVAAWIAQFNKDWPVAVKLLENVLYYSTSQIRTRTRELLKAVVIELGPANAKRVAVVAIGEAGSGSSVIARALRDEVKTQKGYKCVSLLDLARDPRQGVYDAIVLFDDFGGTGNTITSWWTDIGETMLLPYQAHIVVAVVVMNHKAEATVATVGQPVYVDYLDATRDVLGASCVAFDEAEKAVIQRYCAGTGCTQAYVRGYGGCGLLLAFKHQCPNNSLPILWHKKGAWRSLFSRSAL